jgi:hypothetical protein
MKKLLVFFLLLGFKVTFGQLIEGTTSWSTAITGSGVYTYERNAPGVRKFVLFRASDGYWYEYADLFFGQLFLNSRTTVPYMTNKIPCNVQWFSSSNPFTAVGAWLSNAALLYSNTNAWFTPAAGGYRFFSGPDCEPITTSSSTSGPGGFVPPAMTTTAILAIPMPVIGTLIWDITAMCLKVYNGTAWVCL